MEAPITLEDLPRFMIEVRRRARALLQQERHAASLESMDLVNTVIKRLVPAKGNLRDVTWHDADHFLGTMYTAMENRLKDHGRKRTAQKRDVRRTVHLEELRWHDVPGALADDPEQVYALVEALEQLAKRHPRWATVARHWLLGGLELSETAQVMEISEATVKRERAQARLWLAQEILGHREAGEGASHAEGQGL